MKFNISKNEEYFNTFIKDRVKFKGEEDLRISFSNLIQKISKENTFKIPFETHEYTVLKGRIDSLYGNVIIEYKKPKYLTSSSSNKNTKAIEQIKTHIVGLSTKHKILEKRILGIIFDGHKIIFVRYRNNLWDIEEPVDFNKESSKILFQRIFSLGIQGKALIIDNLIQDFNLDNPLIKESIRNFYYEFNNTKNKKVILLYEQWKVLFREVCGYEFDSKKIELQRFLEKLDIEEAETDISKILFSLQTYYALFIKLLAAETITYFKKGEKSFFSSINTSNSKLKENIKYLENGALFKDRGIVNFLESDFFSWYTLIWNNNISNTVSDLIETFKKYDFSSLNLEPKEAKDLIKDIYHFLLPKNIRHSLGEYYTPDWLAEHLIKKQNIPLNGQVKVLDPTCGSGTFLSILINKIKQQNQYSPKLLEDILKSVVGIDLNPLAVIAARTNYIIAISDLITNLDKPIEIPVYLSDSMLGTLEFNEVNENYYSLSTKVGQFEIPSKLVKENLLLDILNVIDESIELHLTFKEFVIKIKDIELNNSDLEKIEFFYNKLSDLEKKGLNGIWCKIIKNIFAPIFLDKFDYIVGNPPWINWQNLPEEYRNSIKKYWDEYKVFQHQGLKARLGSAHDDISVLLTYVVMDKYLKDDGHLAFVLPQNLLQAIGGGEGFRRFKIKDSIPVKVLEVDDFVDVQPFADMGASNKAAVVFLQKNKRTTYPVKYTKWKKKAKGKIPSDESLNVIKDIIEDVSLIAEPITHNESSWLINDDKTLSKLKKLVGNSDYKARKGIDTSLNGVYWGEVNEKLPSNLALFENLFNIGKKKVKRHSVPIEKDLIYPVLRGKDIKKWDATPKIYSLVPYEKTGKCISEFDLKTKYTKAYSYFYKKDKQITALLESRAIYQKHLRNSKVPIHGLYDIGPYTFSKFKVVWKALASGMIAAVISDKEDENVVNKQIIPDHNVTMVCFDDELEAHFLTGLLNSDIVNKFVKSYISWFYSTHILENIKLPKFNRDNKEHISLANLSKKAHEDKLNLGELQKEINSICEKILKI